ncbi:MAG: FGGY-family carbohydrate kinase [Christensenella sp.]|nr:FGGY-family carbohydrate kinase [Christensenella sp.]
MLLMGVDMGTSGCKAVVFDEQWKIAASAYREYGFTLPGQGLLELDAEAVWQGICEVIAEAGKKVDGKITALAVSAIGDVIIPLGSDGKQTRYSIVDFDPRGKAELDRQIQAFGKKKFFQITGMPPLYLGSLAKILWIREHEPQAFAKTTRYATYEDFIVERLGIKPAVSYSEAARTMLFDIRKKDWSDEVLAIAGLKREMLATPVESGIKLGVIPDKICGALGLENGVCVVSGGHDMVCAAVGAGLNEDKPETAVDIAGTIEGIVATMKEPNTSAEMLENNFPCYPCHKGYVTFSVNVTAGCIVRWYRNFIAKDEYESCEEKNINFYEYMQRGVKTEEPGELILLPHFSGSGNPYFDPYAKGALYGMTLDTTREDIARAMIEGLCYELKFHAQAFQNAGMDIHTIRAVGGGAIIDKQLQLKANITGLTVIKGAVSESSAMGAAAYAAVGVNLIENPAQAFSAVREQERVFQPDTTISNRFCNAYEEYRKLSKLIHDFEQ